MTRLCLISDTHGYWPNTLPDADILIHAGDWVGSSTFAETKEFLNWIQAQPHPLKVMIAGNHDRLTESERMFLPMKTKYAPDVHYLCDSGVELLGLKFWGSPVSPRFYNWAWNRDRGESIKKHWDMIPDDIDVLITHCPPFGYLDLSNNYDQSTMKKFTDHLGCQDLRDALFRVHPKLHVFGHIHGSGGKVDEVIDDAKKTILVNASLMDEAYIPSHKPVVIDL